MLLLFTVLNCAVVLCSTFSLYTVLRTPLPGQVALEKFLCCVIGQLLSAGLVGLQFYINTGESHDFQTSFWENRQLWFLKKELIIFLCPTDFRLVQSKNQND